MLLERVLAQWRRLVAFRKDINLLHWVMRSVSFARLNASQAAIRHPHKLKPFFDELTMKYVTKNRSRHVRFMPSEQVFAQ